MRSAILAEMFSRRGLKVALLTALVYTVLLVPFKQFVIVDSLIEVRPASIVPVIMGIVFGPGAALGAAVGNLAGDLFGTLTWGSIGGFVGNFVYVLVAWLIWTKLSAEVVERFDIRAAGRYLTAAVGGSLVCAAIIAVGLQLVGLGDLLAMLYIIALNNVAWTCTLGLLVMWLLYGTLRRCGETLPR